MQLLLGTLVKHSNYTLQLLGVLGKQNSLLTHRLHIAVALGGGGL